jgi:hypothetical protein
MAIDTIINAGEEVLKLFPDIPGSCVPMSALWTAFIKDNTKYPIYVIAGSLYIDDKNIFGNNITLEETKKVFSNSNLDWDGHCWVLFGNLICDISIFRTAYSKSSPKLLKEKILSIFGENKGLFIVPLEEISKIGMRYETKYVLTDDEITSLFKGAYYLIEHRL